MNTSIKFILFCFFSQSFIFSQALTKIKKLDNKLHEISGLANFKDTCLIAHNDGGNAPIIYFLNFQGEIFHEVQVSNAKNIDWEDITIDPNGNIYIADIGNNSNKRKDLCIYKIKSDSLLFLNQIEAEKISFSYADQNDFPPQKDNLNFDAEALAFFQNELYIFTKCRTEPYSGITRVYKLPTEAGTYVLEIFLEIQLKSRRMKLDGVTAADFKSDTLYLMTYSGIEIYSSKENNFVKIKRKSFKKLTQKEALCLVNDVIFIADEKYKSIYDAKLYKLKINHYGLKVHRFGQED
jgi:hypothetical protein